MAKYILKRIILIPIILLISSAIVYFLVNLSDVDPAASILGASATQEDIEALHKEMGLDDPVYIQYFRWLSGAVRGDFGHSWQTNNLVMQEIAQRLPITTKLALLTIFFTVLIGIPLGVLCAVKQYSAADGIINAISKCLGAMPNFWMAMMLMLVFSSKLGWLPSYGIKTPLHWILPVMTLTIQTSGTYLRIVRSSMLDCIRQDYVRTARSKGQKESKVIFLHALKNALLPLITLTGQQFALLMGGALVVETVFSIPGLGSMVISSIKVMDVPLVVGGVVWIALIFLVVTLVIDLLYVLVDPRVKGTLLSVKRSRRPIDDTDEEEEEEAA